MGGVAALELARAGAELTAVIGLWPILDSTRATDATPIRAEVLVVVGALDPLTPEARVDAFRAELERESTPHRIEVLPGVAHAFTVPAVGTDVSTGFAYDADAEAVARTVERINRPDETGRPRVRIHAVGFPLQFGQPGQAQIAGQQFADLMRELCRRNGGTFVALTDR